MVGVAGEAAVVGREQARAAGWVVVVWEGAQEEVQAVVVVRAVGVAVTTVPGGCLAMEANQVEANANEANANVGNACAASEYARMVSENARMIRRRDSRTASSSREYAEALPLPPPPDECARPARPAPSHERAEVPSYPPPLDPCTRPLPHAHSQRLRTAASSSWHQHPTPHAATLPTTRASRPAALPPAPLPLWERGPR